MPEGWVGDPNHWLGRYDEDPSLLLQDRMARDRGVKPTDVDNWSDEDRARAIATMVRENADQAKLCHSCGTDPDAWTDDEFRPLRPPPFKAEIHACEGCRALQRAEESIPNDNKDRGLRAVLVPDASDPD